MDSNLCNLFIMRRRDKGRFFTDAVTRWGMVLMMVALTLQGCAIHPEPLAALPIISPDAAKHNLAGIQAYHAGNWEAAKREFSTALRLDPTLAEAHFNLALTLHRLGEHQLATVHFREAGRLAPRNPEITRSALYRNHLGLSSTFERHWSGGYRYAPSP